MGNKFNTSDKPNLLDDELRASNVQVAVVNFPALQPVSGTLAISNFPGSFAVSNFPATQPVSGPLTNTQLRASAVPVLEQDWPGYILAGTYKRITAAGNTVVKAAAGQLMRVFSGGVGNVTTVTIYDNTTATGTVAATWKTVKDTPASHELNIWMPTGISVNLSVGSDVTLVYR